MRSKLSKSKIQNFRLVSNDIVYSTLENDIFFNDDLIHKSSTSIQEIYYNGSGVFTNTMYGDGLEIDPIDKSVILYEGEFIKYLDSELRIKSKNRETIITNLKKNTSAIKPYRIFIFAIRNELNKLVYYEGNNLTNVNLNINVTSLVDHVDYLSFSLSTLGTWLDGAIEKPFQVAEFSGIHEKTLVCNLNSGAVLLLDIENAQNYTLLPEARFPRKMFPKKGEPNIYIGLMGRRYIEIDIISKKLVKEVSIEQQLRNIKNIPVEQTCWFSIGFSVLYDELYYFICETNFIGVFDPNEGKIIDYHEFEFDRKQYQQLKGGEENLQVKNGNIYCLDTLGNLFELER